MDHVWGRGVLGGVGVGEVNHGAKVLRDILRS